MHLWGGVILSFFDQTLCLLPLGYGIVGLLIHLQIGGNKSFFVKFRILSIWVYLLHMLVIVILLNIYSYIDNINITSKSDVGTKILNYKNPMNFGKYKNIKELDNGRIDFKVINTNQENESQNYSEPTFYTDCSNPITLGYLNKDILANYSVSADASTVSFNGKVLKEANINLDDINYTLNFTIHIVNNLNQSFAYNMKLNVNLNDDNGGIYNGYVYKGKTTSGSEYRFFREVN